MCRELGIRISDDLVRVCEEVESSAIGILLLDLGARDLAAVGQLKYKIVRAITAETLKSPEWLVAYEGARLGWLGEAAEDIVRKDSYFHQLNGLKIGFYDTKRTTTRIEKEPISPDVAWHQITYFRF